MQDGKALQFATSHNLAQNFSKAFGIKFSNKESKEEYVYQTSWGLSTRSIGGLIMSHSDDNGLVLPPKIAPIQVVILPIYGSDEEKKKKVLDKCKEIEDKLRSTEMIRVKTDLTEKNFGEKSFFWEKRGVPVRIEIGPKDIENNAYIVNTRQTLEKEQIGDGALIDYVLGRLEKVQNNLLHNSYTRTYLNIKTVDNYEDFKKEIEANNSVFAFWDGDSKIEERIKEETKATTRCIPFKFLNEKGSSLISGKEGSKVLFSKAY
jgi:prolyl-tRNA synthetase